MELTIDCWAEATTGSKVFARATRSGRELSSEVGERVGDVVLTHARGVQNYSKRAHSTRELRLKDFGAGFEEEESDHEHPDKHDPLTRPLPEDFTFD
eukprot:1820460-Rhodomonas_salina.1